MFKSNKKVIPALVHALIFGFSATAVADAHSAKKEFSSAELGSVNVWATEVSSSSVYLGENDIAVKQADHLSDLLDDIPGVGVGGTHSINNRINIRGFQDEDLEITLDGAKVQNVNMFHHIGNLLINPDILKKADIQVGNSSVVNGGLGGAVAFETKDGLELLSPGQNIGARVSGNFNSNDSTGGSIAGYGRLSENSDFLIYYRGVNKNNWKDGNGTETIGVDGTVYNALLKLGVDINEQNRLSLSYDHLHDEGDYTPRPDFGRAYNEARTGETTYPTEYDRTTLSLKHELDLGDKLFVSTSIYQNANELERYEKNDDGSAVRPGKFEGLLNGIVATKGINLKAQTLLSQENMAHQLTYGFLVDKQTSEVEYDKEKYGDDEAALTRALFIEDQITFGSGLTLTPGVRYTKYDFDGAYGKIDDAKVTYGLAGEYQVNENLSLQASSTTLYKGVEMVDVLATNRVAVQDNEELKPETGLNNQIGLKYFNNNILGADALGVQLNYFKTKVDNYIVSVWGGPPTFPNTMENAGTLYVDGFEASMNYKVNNLTALLSYSHTTSEFKETKEPLAKEPGDVLTLGLNYKFSPEMTLYWNSTIVREESDRPTTDNYNVKQGYSVHDVALNWNPTAVKGLTVTAGIDNLFDRAYVSHISENRTLTPVRGQPETASTADYEPGRNIKVTASYKF